jgi:hypothetical protein
MDSPKPSEGAWSRKAWILVTALTVLGLVGILVDFSALFGIHGPLIGGCGGLGGLGVLLMLGMATVVLTFLFLVGVLATIGLISLWRRSRWGPRLLIPSNLLSMAFFGFSPVGPGDVGWAVVLILFGAAPAVAVGLLALALLSRPRQGAVLRDEAVLLGMVALILLPAFAYGMSLDLAAAFAPAPQLVAHAGCGGSALLITP